MLTEHLTTYMLLYGRERETLMCEPAGLRALPTSALGTIAKSNPMMNPREMTMVECADKISDIINGVTKGNKISKHEILYLLTFHWSELAKLAHKIHGDEKTIEAAEKSASKFRKLRALIKEYRI